MRRAAIIRSHQAFTILEMGIILMMLAALTAIVTIKVNGLMAKSRDKSRLGNLSLLNKAINLYFANNAFYPYDPLNLTASSGPELDYQSNPDATLTNPVAVNWIPNLTPDYFRNLPKDPAPGAASNACLGTGANRTYVYRSDGSHFKVIFYCANETTIKPTDPFADPVRCVGSVCYAWAVTNDVDFTTTNSW